LATELQKSLEECVLGILERVARVTKSRISLEIDAPLGGM